MSKNGRFAEGKSAGIRSSNLLFHSTQDLLENRDDEMKSYEHLLRDIRTRFDSSTTGQRPDVANSDEPTLTRLRDLLKRKDEDMQTLQTELVNASVDMQRSVQLIEQLKYAAFPHASPTGFAIAVISRLLLRRAKLSQRSIDGGQPSGATADNELRAARLKLDRVIVRLKEAEECAESKSIELADAKQCLVKYEEVRCFFSN